MARIDESREMDAASRRTFRKLSRESATNAAIYGPFRRNLLHNGEMLVSQRVGPSTFVSVVGGGVFTDRWSYAPPSATTAIYPNYLTNFEDFGAVQLVDAGGAAKASFAAGEYSLIVQQIEGRNLQHLRWGTPQAKPLCLSFVAYTSSPGTYIIELYHVVTGKSISRAVTLSAAPTRYYVTFPGNTVDAIANNSNAGIGLQFWLGTSTTYGGGAALNTTGYAVAGNARAVGQTNLFAVAARQFALTGCQLEIGTVPTEFEHLTYAQTLIDCQRYFQRWTQPPLRGQAGVGANPLISRAGMPLPVTMRAVPTASITAPLPIFDGAITGTADSIANNFSTTSTCELQFNATLGAGGTYIRPVVVYQGGTNSLDLSAEI